MWEHHLYSVVVLPLISLHFLHVFMYTFSVICIIVLCASISPFCFLSTLNSFYKVRILQVYLLCTIACLQRYLVYFTLIEKLVQILLGVLKVMYSTCASLIACPTYNGRNSCPHYSRALQILQM
jgi:hypothetical protein